MNETKRSAVTICCCCDHIRLPISRLLSNWICFFVAWRYMGITTGIISIKIAKYERMWGIGEEFWRRLCAPERHPSLSGAPSSALHLPFLTSGPDLGAWPDCWVSMEFLHALIPRKGSGSTTTTFVLVSHSSHSWLVEHKHFRKEGGLMDWSWQSDSLKQVQNESYWIGGQLERKVRA